MTVAQKRTVKIVSVIALGSLAASIAARGDGASTRSSERQFPCGCTPPAGVQ